MSRSPVIAILPLLALCQCREPEREPSGGTTGASTSRGSQDTGPASLDDSSAADSTGSAVDPCIDVYHGNQDPPAAVDLGLDTTDTARIVLGNGVVNTPAEIEGDGLVVCSGASDYFALASQCPGWLSIELRASSGGIPELRLYDGSLQPLGSPLAQALGSWDGFFLKPLHVGIEPGPYLIEVVPSGGPQRYTLTVTVLPTCSAS